MELTKSQEVFLASTLLYGVWTRAIYDDKSYIMNARNTITNTLSNKYYNIFDQITLQFLRDQLITDTLNRRLDGVPNESKWHTSAVRLKYAYLNDPQYDGDKIHDSMLWSVNDKCTFLQFYQRIRKHHDPID